MVVHFLRMGGIILLLVLCMIYPFLPGQYDGLAVHLSTMAQLFGVVGLLLLPIGVLWLVYEMRKTRRRKRNPPNANKEYYFALVSLIVASILAILVSLATFFGISISFGVLTLALWFYTIFRLIPRLKLLKQAEIENINPIPLYLIFVPVTVLLFQVILAAPMTEFSRNYAIAHSAEFINDIEAYRNANERYPDSLLATWKDYYPAIVGIEKFHFALNGDSYNLFFEQPRFLLDNLGTREFVVYNPLDEHMIISHTAWILLLTPEELATRQGWYAVHDASSPHWKYFWFD
jgi:hypothetical protein